MFRFRLVLLGTLCFVLFASSGAAQGLSKYRDFEFGMDIETVAKQLQIAPNPTTVSRRPEVVQTLTWWHYSYLSSSPQPKERRSSRR